MQALYSNGSMQITLKLYAALSEFLPAGSVRYGFLLDVSGTDTVYSVLERYQVPRERAHLVLLNGVYLSTEQREQLIFKEGDTLAIWPPVAGG